MKIRLANGVWFNGLSAILAGGGAVTGATTAGIVQIFGWALVALGIGLFLWGMQLDGRHIWHVVPTWLSRHMGWRFRRLPPVRLDPDLFVARVIISDATVKAENYLTITFVAINATGQTLLFTGVQGEIEISLKRAIEMVSFPLPTPVLKPGSAAGSISGGEFMFDLEQALRPEHAAIYQRHMDEGATASFAFNGLNIGMALEPGRGQRRFPLWDGVTFGLGRSVTGRISSSVGQASASGSASMS